MEKSNGKLPTVSEVARGLGVDKKTIGTWVERYKTHFSPMATGEDNALMRRFSDDDFLVLNTIRSLSAPMPNNNKDWTLIGTRLAGGYRDHDFPPEAAFVRSMVVPAATALKIMDTEGETRAALARLDEVRRMYETRLAEKETEVAKLNERIAKIEAAAAERERLMRAETSTEKEKLLRELAQRSEELGEMRGQLKELREASDRPRKGLRGLISGD